MHTTGAGYAAADAEQAEYPAPHLQGPAKHPGILPGMDTLLYASVALVHVSDHNHSVDSTA